MNKWLELILGLILVLVPIIVAYKMDVLAAATLAFILGGLVVGIVLIGLMFIMLSISDIMAK